MSDDERVRREYVATGPEAAIRSLQEQVRADTERWQWLMDNSTWYLEANVPLAACGSAEQARKMLDLLRHGDTDAAQDYADDILRQLGMRG